MRSMAVSGVGVCFVDQSERSIVEWRSVDQAERSIVEWISAADQS